MFFGFYIAKNKKALLTEYPHNFGYDEFWPRLTSDDGYKEMYRNFYNTEDNRKKIGITGAKSRYKFFT